MTPLDAPNHDTALARVLLAHGVLPLERLEACLRDVRAQPHGPTLARLLVSQGVLDEPRAREALNFSTNLTPRVASARAHQAGAVVAGYRLEEKLGEGGMGAVFRARHLKTGATRALKLVLLEDDMARARFVREAAVMGSVDGHPNVTRVHTSGTEAGRGFLVMEFAPGGDLGDRLRHGPMKPQAAVRLLRDVASGVAQIHACGVLHRDLKPANVLFDAADVPKVVDFGLAHVADGQNLTQTGEILGTPAYMAPEQALGDQTSISEATDVYGLGALLYHCLTGRPPAQGATLIAVLDAVLQGAPTPPHVLNPAVDAELEGLVFRALAQNPNERHASAHHFREALIAYLERAGRPPPPTARRRTAVAIAGGLLLATGLGLATRGLAPAPSPTPPAAAAVTPSPSAAPLRARAPDPLRAPDWPSWRWIGPGPGTGVEGARLVRARQIPDSKQDATLALCASGVYRWQDGSDTNAGSWKRTTAAGLGGLSSAGVIQDPRTGDAFVAGGTLKEEPQRTVRTVWGSSRPPELPSPREGLALAVDPQAKSLYAFGGASRAGLAEDLWRLDEETWHAVPTRGASPSARRGSALAYEPSQGTLVLFGGQVLDAEGQPRDVAEQWSFTAGRWEPTPLRQGWSRPLPRREGSLVVLDQGFLVLFGGRFLDGFLTDVWIWTGGKWKDLHLPFGPRGGPTSATWDPVRERLIVTGRVSPDDPTQGTWELNELPAMYKLRELYSSYLGDPKIDPGASASVLLQHATVSAMTSSYPNCIRLCDDALAALEGQPASSLRAQIRLQRGVGLQRQGSWAQAEEEYTLALTLAPGFSRALRMRGNVRMSRAQILSKQGEPDLARGYFQRALADLRASLEGDPNPLGHLDAARVCKQLRRFEEARVHAETTLLGLERTNSNYKTAVDLHKELLEEIRAQAPREQ